MNTTNKLYQAQITVALAAVGWLSMTLLYALCTMPSDTFNVIEHAEAHEQIQVIEVQNELPPLAPADVALWYVEKNTELLKADSIDEMEQILQEQQQFATDLMYRELLETL